MIINELQSPADLFSAVQPHITNSHFSSWYGGLSRGEAEERLLRGSSADVDKAQELVAAIEDKLNFSSTMPEWENDFCGAFPDVPAFLSGSPFSMRAKVIKTREIAPIRIYVNPSSSGSIPASKMLSRGLAVTALLLGLSRARPVELFLWDIWGSGSKMGGAKIKLPTQPLDLGSIVFALSHPNFARSFLYRYFMDVLEIPDIIPTCAREIQPAREALNAQPDDIVLPIFYAEHEFNDPIGWVRNRLEESLKINLEQ